MLSTWGERSALIPITCFILWIFYTLITGLMIVEEIFSEGFSLLPYAAAAIATALA